MSPILPRIRGILLLHVLRPPEPMTGRGLVDDLDYLVIEPVAGFLDQDIGLFSFNWPSVLYNPAQM